MDVARDRGVTVRYASMRRELFALHLPNPDRVQADYAVLSELSKGLSGGDILNICVNAIHAGSTDANPELWKVTQGIRQSSPRRIEIASETSEMIKSDVYGHDIYCGDSRKHDLGVCDALARLDLGYRSMV